MITRDAIRRICVVFTVAIIAPACSGKSDNGKGSLPAFKIGVLTGLTGENATYGRSTREGVELAQAEIVAAGTLKRQLEIVFEDDQMSPTTGVTAFQRMISAYHPPVVIGPFGSSVVLAVAPIANNSQTVIISASATADNIADAGDFVFRITPPNSKQGADIAEFSYGQLKARKAAILFERNDYGETLRQAFSKQFSSMGGQIVAEQGMADGATNFRSALTSIAAAHPDVVFFPLHSQEATLALRQAYDLKLKNSFISADGAMTAELLQGAGPAADGVYFSTLALGYGIADSAIAKFDSMFVKKYGKEPDVYAAYYYEVTKLVARALGAAGDSSSRIRDYLYRMRGDSAYHGITGITSFDDRGEVTTKQFYIYRVVSGKFTRVKSGTGINP